MGVIIGFYLIPAGMLIRNTRDYFIAVLRSFFVVLCTTIITGLTALLIAYLVVHAAPTEDLFFEIPLSQILRHFVAQAQCTISAILVG